MPTDLSPEIAAVCQQVAALDAGQVALAAERMSNLTKPIGSLGRLESVAVQVAAIQGTDRPAISKPRIIVCAADHGVVSEGVTAYPASVTPIMAQLIGEQLAAVTQLAAASGAEVRVYDVGIADPDFSHDRVRNVRVASGTQNMTAGPAMSREEAAGAVLAGVRAVEDAIADGVDIVGLGEMGIGNSTAAAALTAVLTGTPVSDCVGAGAGADPAQMERKVAAITTAIAVNGATADSPFETLAAIGGLEIAMMTGVVLGAAAHGLPVVSDGYIAGSAVLVAQAMCPTTTEYVIFSHRSAEPGHSVMYRYLNAEPLLQLDLRLGEGTGCALVFPMIDGSCRVLSNMLTFAEAGIG